MAEELTTVQVDVATRDKLRVLAKEDKRSMTSEFDWLVDQEFSRRYSQPQPLITVEQAQQAAAELSK